jgi:hypothetical protein
MDPDLRHRRRTPALLGVFRDVYDTTCSSSGSITTRQSWLDPAAVLGGGASGDRRSRAG